MRNIQEEERQKRKCRERYLDINTMKENAKNK